MLYKGPLYEISLSDSQFDPYEEFDVDYNPVSDLVAQDDKWKCCALQLNAISFGLATNTIWRFWVVYDSSHANWNFEKPKLPSHYETPRTALAKLTPSATEFTPAPKMPSGYRSKDMQRFVDRDFPDNYIKLAWSYPCPHIDKESKYVHPGEDRFLLPEELEAIYGCTFGDVPLAIKQYLEKHISFFTGKLWGAQNFEATYDNFANKWRMNHFTDMVPFVKHYQYSTYTPPPMP